MAAYNLGERFDPPPKAYPIFEPGTFQFEEPAVKPNKVPFLAKQPRKTLCTNPIWTHTIHNSALPVRIRNITSLKSNIPRFPYEAFSEEDLKEILCKCGIQNPCECPIPEDEPVQEVPCQAKVKRRLFKGFVGRNDLGDEGISAPSKNDLGYDVSDNGTQKRIMKSTDDSPPFYDVRVLESTQFYHGCKWSRQTSKRGQKGSDDGPGPAAYTLDKKEPTFAKMCEEAVRSHKRKTARQLRFIEMVQQQCILENRPGPSHYHPEMPKGTDLQYLGPKSDRFPTSEYSIQPGPADYWVRRDFDALPELEKIPLATLPEPACFGMKSRRFVPQKEEGPSAASYNAAYKPCQFMHCPTAGFSSSAMRFKPDKIEESDDEEEKDDTPEKTPCPKPMWQFKSKSIRMKPLVKVYNEQSPADLPQSVNKIQRSVKNQYAAPFFSSEGRFQPWYNYTPVHGRLSKSNQDFLNLEKPRCVPAFNRGPLFRAERFPEESFITPAPNAYQVKYGGIEAILDTFNKRLLDNMQNQHKFVYQPPPEPPNLTVEQRYKLVLQKCIDLLEPEEEEQEIEEKSKARVKITSQSKIDDKAIRKPKLLRTFLYIHQFKRPS